MKNYELEHNIIEKVGQIEINKQQLKRYNDLKTVDSIADRISNETNMSSGVISSIISLYKQYTKEYNDGAKPLKDANEILLQSIGNEIIADYEKQGIDNHLLLETSPVFPGVGTVQVKAKRELYLTDNENVQEKLVEQMINNGNYEMLEINTDKYFEKSKEYYAQHQKHLEGVYETTPTLTVKINPKR